MCDVLGGKELWYLLALSTLQDQHGFIPVMACPVPVFLLGWALRCTMGRDYHNGSDENDSDDDYEGDGGNGGGGDDDDSDGDDDCETPSVKVRLSCFWLQF